ncbi:MAG TPA: cbb3-type cytochrome c oxidase subunit I [Clostridia bacterium]|nr:cbb3-type cytochrome c oxidase subunit I [Clostridia bacterium]
MAASLLTSGPANPGRPAGISGGTGGIPHAVSVRLPLRFMVTGVLAFMAGVACLVLRPDILATYHYNQYVIATTHLFVLGWISSVVMGAMYQLVPVALETKLYSERLARWHFILHLVGFVGMVWMFWKWDMKQVGHFGSVFGVGVLLFLYNLGRTLLRIPHWNTVGVAVASALAWFGMAILAGLMIAAGKCSYETGAATGATTMWSGLIEFLEQAGRYATRFDQMAAMHAHAHLGAVGVFVMLIVGISYKLVPMFSLSEVQKPWRAALSVALINLGLGGAFVTILLRSPFKLAFTLLTIAGLVFYGFELSAILAARKRRTLDGALIQFITALTLLVPTAGLAVVLSWPGLPLTLFTGQLENLYGFVGLIGVVSLAITGMLYKILPFLVWYSSYGGLIGKRKLPALADLYSARLQKIGFILYLLGLTITAAGIVLSNVWLCRTGAAVLGLSGIFFVVNVGKILSHLRAPREEAATRGVNAQLASLSPKSVGMNQSL